MNSKEYELENRNEKIRNVKSLFFFFRVKNKFKKGGAKEKNSDWCDNFLCKLIFFFKFKSLVPFWYFFLRYEFDFKLEFFFKAVKYRFFFFFRMCFVFRWFKSEKKNYEFQKWSKYVAEKSSWHCFDDIIWEKNFVGAWAERESNPRLPLAGRVLYH